MTLLAQNALFFLYVGSAFLVGIVAFVWGSHSKVMGAGVLLASILVSNILFRIVMAYSLGAQHLTFSYAVMDLVLAMIFIFIFLNSNFMNRNRWAAFVAAAHIGMFSWNMAGVFSPDLSRSGDHRLILNLMLIAAMLVCLIGFTPKSRKEAFGIIRAKWLYLKHDVFKRIAFLIRLVRINNQLRKQSPLSTKEIDIKIGKKVREARVLRELSREDLAKAMGVSVSQVQKYETGASRITASNLFALATYFDVEMEFFFEGVDVKNLDWVFKAS